MPVSSRAFKCWCIHFLISIYSGTYFSENALLPGLVHSNFKEDFLARQYLVSLKVSVPSLFHKISKQTNSFIFCLVQSEAERYPNGMPHAFIAAQFKQLGLDTYTHNFSVQYPLDENEVTRLSW